MGLLNTLKSLLGLDGGRSRASSTEPDVHVEREPSAESERAVKQGGPGTAGGAGAESDTPRAPRSATSSRSEADAETADEPAPTGADEPSDDAAADVADATEPEESDDATSEDESATAPDEAAASESADSPDVVEINGIGPTYADRLRSAGVETVADLAGSDAETVADAAETSPSRAEDWIEQATDF